MKKNSDAKIAAIKRYDDKKYDRFTVRLPKGTKEQIKATEKSLNSFITEAISEKLKTQNTRQTLDKNNDLK